MVNYNRYTYFDEYALFKFNSYATNCSIEKMGNKVAKTMNNTTAPGGLADAGRKAGVAILPGQGK